MAVKIEWPQNLLVPDEVIDTWFVKAVADNRIEPRYLSARTAQARAEALENAGIIRLAK
jgi:hypothetical protein